MLRLAPENYLRFVQSEKYQATFGGAEANVAVSLANYGTDVSFVTKLPEHEIGQAAVNSLRKFGVDTSLITRGGDRVGIYYCEKGDKSGSEIYSFAGAFRRSCEYLQESGRSVFPRLRNAYGNNEGARSRYFHSQILPVKRLRRLEGYESARRAVPADKVYTHGRYRQR